MVAVLAHALAVIRRDVLRRRTPTPAGPPWRPCTTTRRRSSPATCPPPSSTTTRTSGTPTRRWRRCRRRQAAVHAAPGAAPRLSRRCCGRTTTRPSGPWSRRPTSSPPTSSAWRSSRRATTSSSQAAGADAGRPWRPCICPELDYFMEHFLPASALRWMNCDTTAMRRISKLCEPSSPSSARTRWASSPRSAPCWPEHNVNILDISQTILQDYFTMIMLVDASQTDLPFAELADRSGAGRQGDGSCPSASSGRISSTPCTPFEGAAAIAHDSSQHNDIMSTIDMIDQQHLDIRTITMGISLLDCADPDPKAACRKIYDKITRSAEKLVATGEAIEREFGIPIVNKRISVTPIALVAGAVRDRRTMSPSPWPWTRRPRRWASTSSAASPPWCRRASPPATGSSSPPSPRRWPPPSWSAPRVNVGSTKAGINMDAVARDGPHHQGRGRAHRRPGRLRLRQAGGVLQRRGGQPLHGRRLPRRGRARTASSTWACPAPAWCTTPCRR